MENEAQRLTPPEKMEKKKPEDEIQVDDDMSPKERVRVRLARTIIDIVRKRLSESQEKFRLRKELRAERNRLRKEKKELNRRKKLGEAMLDKTTKVEK